MVYTAAGAVSCLSLTTFAGLKAAKHPSASPCFLSNKARALATRSSSLSEDSIHVCPPRTGTQNNKAPAPSLLAGCYTHGLWRTDSSSSGDDTERGDLNGCVSSSNLLRSRFFCHKKNYQYNFWAVFSCFLALVSCNKKSGPPPAELVAAYLVYATRTSICTCGEEHY